MISFIQLYSYLREAFSSGNYVAIDVDDDIDLLGDEKIHSGKVTPEEKRHVTLMYSKTSAKDHEAILSMLKDKYPPKIVADVVGYECFDALPKEGERDENLSCLVVKLQSPVLSMIHKHLASIGLEHSYPEFAPHMTLIYDMDRSEAHALKDKLNKTNYDQHVVYLSGFRAEPTREDFSKTFNEETLAEMSGGGVSYNDLKKEVEGHGWFEKRKNGGHTIFKHPVHKHPLSIPRHKEISARLVLKTRKLANPPKA